MSFSIFLKEQEKNFPLPIYLFIYKDEFFYKEAVKIIRETYCVDKGFEIDFYDLRDIEQNITTNVIINNLNTSSLFANKKIVVINNVQMIKRVDLEKLGGYINNQSPDSMLFLFNAGDLKKESKLVYKDIPAIRIDMSKNEISKLIEKKAVEKGIKLSRDAIGLLCDVLGDNPAVLNNEIEKLSLLGKEDIDSDDINEVFYGTRSFSPFELTSAIVEGKVSKAVKIHKSLEESSDKLMLIGAINWQLSRLTANKRISYKVIYDCFAILFNTEVRLKSINPELPLDQVIFKLIHFLKR